MKDIIKIRLIELERLQTQRISGLIKLSQWERFLSQRSY
jgi:hypothetical protein